MTIFVVRCGKVKGAKPYGEAGFFLKKKTAETYLKKYKKESDAKGEDLYWWIDIIHE